MSRRLAPRSVCTLLTGLTLACTLPRDSARVIPPAHHALRYDVSLREDLGHMEVNLCMGAGEATLLRPGRDDAGSRLTYARLLRPGPVQRLALSGGKFVVPGGAGERCVAYGVALQDGGSLASLVRHAGDALVTSLNAWLYRPEHRSPQLTASVRFALPASIDVFMPFARGEGDAYTLRAQDFRFDAYVAFGRGVRHPFTHRGVHVDALNLGTSLSTADAEGWIRHHLDAVAPLKSALATRPLVVMLMPSAAHNEVFGCAARGGADTVLAFVPRGRSREALEEDWVLSHELAHFALPFVRREDAWAPEGFASYYQEVLRGRSGQRSTLRVAEALYRAFLQGESESGERSLRDEALHMAETSRYRLVYWGGAAIFFAVDVAMRRRDVGRQGLADAAANLRAREANASLWTAAQLLSALDGAEQQPVASRIAAEALSRPFPDFRATFAELGITPRGAELQFDANPEHVALRTLVLGGP
jgi:hypothetical protein